MPTLVSWVFKFVYVFLLALFRFLKALGMCLTARRSSRMPYSPMLTCNDIWTSFSSYMHV